jgi:nucleoid DNA-binding protein
MRKIEIAHRMHQEAGISEQEAASLLNWVLELFKSTLQQGEPVSVPNFGVFTVRSKVCRNGRNPRTGQPLIIETIKAQEARSHDVALTITHNLESFTQTT